MSEPVKCFFLEPTDRLRLSLRRYRSGDSAPCRWHNASNIVGEEPIILNSEGTIVNPDHLAEYPRDDPRWPTMCEQCGLGFEPDDNWQVFTARIYTRSDNGGDETHHPAPVGAMWFADWMTSPDSNQWKGPDGHCLMVKTPGGDWCVDSRCSNCGSPDDEIHKCWIRHGDPKNPETLTVDKDGVTCNAGAGSIQAGNFHGFLRQGYLVYA